MIKRFFRNWWVTSIGTMLLLALLFTVGLPIFVGFFQPILIRILFGLLFIALWGLWFFLRRRKMKKGEDALTEEITRVDRAGEEANAVQLRMKEALAKLREASGVSKSYLYTKPWYVIIGPPGAGKTTALLNSGLRFPYMEDGVGDASGTRDLDFLLADEAILVDTAGRYTTQDSDGEVDKSGWHSLLGLLRKHRPVEPINGVFVAIPVDELQRGDMKTIDRHSNIVRRRLNEVRQELKTEVPVYLLLTKSDKLAGFVEYFADLDVQGRRAVFGHTFDWKGPKIDSNGIIDAFDGMTNDIASRYTKRLHEEADLKRRGLILGFPSQLHALRASLHRFMEGVFLEGEFSNGRLRGFYLTSGMQDGTALDRIIDSISPNYSGEREVEQKTGRAYFLNRLLQDVVFPEAGLQVADAKLLRKRKIQSTSLIAGLCASAAILIAAWGVSYFGNRGFQQETLEASALVSEEINFSRVDLAQVGQSDVPLEQLVPLLNQLRELPEGYAAREAGNPELSRRFGLFQSGLSRRNVEAYQRGLRRILMPRIILRLEDQMERNLNNPVELYEPLKVYLMLGGAAPEGRINPDTVRNYVERDFARNLFPGSEMRPLRDDLTAHMKALVKDPSLQSAWEGRRAPLDGNLVAAARASVGQLSLAERAYAIMKENAANLEGDWRMDAILQQGDLQAFANPAKVANKTIPYFFTKDGFTKSYAVRLATVEQSLRGELWVVEEDVDSASVRREMGNLRAGVTNSYVTEYIERWEGVINSLHPANYFDNPQAYRAFVRSPSPLKKVLTEVRDNTVFSGGAMNKAAELAGDRAKRNRLLRIAGQLSEAAGEGGMSSDQQIENHFSKINEWTGTNENPAEIDAFVNLTRESFKQVLVAQSAGSGASRALLAQAMAPLEQAAFEVPDLVSGFVKGVANGGSAAQSNIMQGELSSVYQQEVFNYCRNATQSRYPFDLKSTQDADLREVRAAFGEAGRVVSFVDQQLSDYIDKSGRSWRWVTDAAITRNFGAASLQSFQKADLLNDAFVNGLQLEIEVSKFGPDVSRIEISTGGAKLSYDPQTFDPQLIVWQLGGGIVRSSEIKVFGRDSSGRETLLWEEKASGIWSLFRVFDKAAKRNSGVGKITAAYKANDSSGVEFKISFPAEQNPFSGGGLWAVTCAPRL